MVGDWTREARYFFGRSTCRCALLQVHGKRSAQVGKESAQRCPTVGGWTRENKEVVGKDAYLWCHGAHITLFCDGDEGRGAAGTAV
ncbi:hypothetical protein KCV04_g45, partial [Aureobasidium melanogenum]